MKKHKLFSVLAVLILVMTLIPAAFAQDAGVPMNVAVGIVPEAAFVEAVCG